MSKLATYTKKINDRFFTQIGREKSRIRKRARFTRGYAMLFGKKFGYPDNEAFLTTYYEIFEKEIYKFSPGNKKTILDCGANMGLSILYFSRNYPNHKIIAFEPDESVYSLLSENIKTYELHNVQLLKKAAWNKEEVLEFYTDSGLGGRIGETYTDRQPTRIEAVRLKDYITDDIDFLKIDIEGAEYTVLQDCKDVLSKVNNVFFEYHGHHIEQQKLHELLAVLQENNFHYYIKESSTREKPFVDTGLICEIFDMAINVFGYHVPRPIETPK